MQAVAPSLSPAALPAVTLPCGRNGVFRAPSSSSVVPGRGGSSAVARPQPFSTCAGGHGHEVGLHPAGGVGGGQLALAVDGIGVAALPW